MLPLIAMCDRWDIGGLSTGFHWQTGRGYRVHVRWPPGGVGITRLGFQPFERLVANATAPVVRCPCRSGLPLLVQLRKSAT